jgi:hypothetical protein
MPAAKTCCGVTNRDAPDSMGKCTKDQTLEAKCTKQLEDCLTKWCGATVDSFDVDIDGAVVDEA